MIMPLGKWALLEALNQLREWIKSGVCLPTTTMSVNVSTPQLADPGFPDAVAEALIRGYRHAGARDIPPALAPHLRHEPPPPTRDLSRPLLRQFLRWTWADTAPKFESCE